MKKILFSLFVFLCFPIITLAADYTIESYIIDVNILENGDAEVSEIFLVNGSLINGYKMNLFYESTASSLHASDISNIKISGKNASSISFNTFSDIFTEYELVNHAIDGLVDKYTVTPLDSGYEILMYHPLNGERYVFKLDYTLEDVVIGHNGFAEFYWNFFSGELSDNIHDLQVRVTLPGLDESDTFRFWAHGPLSGKINDASSNTNNIVLATIDELEANGILDIRITFDNRLVNNLSEYSADTLDDIIEEETKRAEEANALREDIRFKYYTALVATVIFYIALVASAIYIYIKYDKERKPIFKLKYNREFIDGYNVEVVDYLMHKNITENALSASIMNLIYKKNIKVEKIEQTKDDYLFTLISRDKLNDTENALVDFLFTNVGKGNTFTTANLRNYASSPKTCQTFMNTYTNWKGLVIKDGETQEFFESKKKYVIVPFILLIISILLMVFIIYYNIELITGVITVLFAIFFLIYVLSFSKKTQKGIEHYARWQAFKNFLNDFGNFSIKELPEIVLWERYLVYATIFGLADKVEKTMNVKINEVSTADIDYYTLNYITNIHIANLITTSMHSAINSSQVAINQINASSSMSSGGGFGGGFSSGGGFGGGGRSGGGF